MTTVNQDYPGHTRPRPSNSPHLSAIPDSHAHSQAAVTDAWTEAFARLQQQVQYNTTALEDQRRHLSEFNDVVRTLHAEIGSLWRRVDAIKDDHRPRPGVKVDEGDIDVLTSELQHVAHKANEIDSVKLQLEIMTRRLRRLEGHPSPVAVSTTDGPPFHNHNGPSHQYSRQPHHPAYSKPGEESRPISYPASERPAPPDPRIPEHTQQVPPFRSLDGPNGAGAWRAANHAGTSPQIATSAPRQDGSAASGWNAVNTNQQAKRNASVDGSGLHDSTPGSPKRQKLATLAPRTTSFPEQPNGHGTPQHIYEPSQPTRPAPADAPHNPAAPASSLRFVPFPRENGHPEPWRHEHPETSHPRPKARKSGGEEDVKPETEWREWPAGGTNEPYHRDPQHAYHLSSTPLDSYRQPTSYSPDGAPGDTPSPALHESGKKSRTKPTRNADGILIRKDGRPDMRSISSAMNLRKVHAKKEAERGSVAPGDISEGHTPADGDDRGSTQGSGQSPTPSSSFHGQQDVPMAEAEAPAQAQVQAQAQAQREAQAV